jgi:hypothetical protein
MVHNILHTIIYKGNDISATISVISVLLVRKYQILVHKITPKFDISAPIVQK